MKSSLGLLLSNVTSRIPSILESWSMLILSTKSLYLIPKSLDISFKINSLNSSFLSVGMSCLTDGLPIASKTAATPTGVILFELWLLIGSFINKVKVPSYWELKTF